MPKHFSHGEEIGFLDHLEELRIRLGRCLIYIVAGMIAAWYFRQPLLTILERPAQLAAHYAGLGKLPFRVFEPAGGFMLLMVICFVAGIVITAPLWMMELWLFVEPALERNEKRWVVFVLPLGIVLFFSGVVFCYWIAVPCFVFFFNINRSMGIDVELTLAPYLRFLLIFMLALGASFELPLVLMFLARVGIIDSKWMLKYWRHATVGIFVIAAVITPTVDPITMTLCALPMVALYFLGLALVRLMERKRTVEPVWEDAAESEPLTVVLPDMPAASVPELAAFDPAAPAPEPEPGSDWEQFYRQHPAENPEGKPSGEAPPEQ